jgi:SAM-dependent methyltransferase
MGGALAAKPLDRALLAAVAELAGGGRTGDLGCGPGHVAAHLAGLGADVIGVDLSDGMVEVARARVPGAEFVQGDLRRLPLADGALAAAVALYSLIHLPPGDLPVAARGIARVLRPGGHALVAFHRGDEVHHLDTWWGHAVDIDFRSLDPDVVAGHLGDAGMELVARVDRAPIPGAEAATQRSYLLARVPAG